SLVSASDLFRYVLSKMCF
ncbi:hypothetical protein AWZ03_014398, partial [Drosophila navojoa]